MDSLKFEAAVDKIRNEGRAKAGIGTLSEKSVHAVFKEYYGGGDENKEIKIGSFVADIVNERGIIEVQTKMLYRLKDKLEAFLPVCRVTVVHPVVAADYIQWIDPETGELLQRRRSPKKQNALTAVAELYGLKPLLKNENLTVCLPMIETEEIRLKTDAKRGRAKAKQKLDTMPVKLIDEILLTCSDDYAALLPGSLEEEFTSGELAKAARIRLDEAQSVLNVCCFVGAVENVGKRGRSNLYKKIFKNSL